MTEMNPGVGMRRKVAGRPNRLAAREKTNVASPRDAGSWRRTAAPSKSGNERNLSSFVV
jgi:hypothetical protein